MKHNLLIKMTAASALLSVLGACSDVDTGYDPKINSAHPVVISEDDMFEQTITEDSGVVEVNLVAGALIDGNDAALYEGAIQVTQMEFEVNKNFVTPQADSNTIANAKISPFIIAEDGITLLVDTDKFSEGLRYCDSTDLRGGPQTDLGGPTPDGFLDFPTSVTYTISYEINNGYNYTPGTEIPRRTLELTVNAATDPVTSVAIGDVSVPSGGKIQAVAQTAPVYACNSNITYSVADNTVATVNETTGEVTGVSRGTTTITATSVDGGHTATATVTVTAGFTLDITNGDVDALGSYTGTKSIPECVRTALVVDPTLHIEGESLMGDYAYNWTSSDAAVVVESEVAREFGGTAILAPANVGDTATLTAAYSSGDTAGVAAGQIDSKSIDVTVVDNIACDTTNPDGVTAYDFSAHFEETAVIGAGHIRLSPEGANHTRWVPLGSMGAIEPAIGAGFNGSNSLKVTALDVNLDNPINKNGVGFLYQRWNGNAGSWTASNFGQTTDIGQTFEFSVWIKLDKLVAEGEERTLTNFLFAWKTADDATYHSLPEYNGWARRNAPFNMNVTKTLANTTEWQLVEFGEYTIPEEWDLAGQPIKFGYQVNGDIADGDEFLFEDIAVVAK